MIGKVSTTADSGVVSINNKKGVISKIQIGDTDFSDRVAQNVVTNSNASVTATIAANTYLKCTGQVTYMNITLGTPSALYDTEYSLSFVAGTAFTPTFNAPVGYTIVYPDGPITTENGSLYEVNFAVCAGNKISCIYVPSNTTAEWTDTQDATLTSGGQMLASYTAYSQGRKYTGAIPSQPATVWTPTTTDQTIAYGKYLAGNQTVKGDANLIAANIKNGVSIFGITGTYGGGGSGGIVGTYKTVSTSLTQMIFSCSRVIGTNEKLYIVPDSLEYFTTLIYAIIIACDNATSLGKRYLYLGSGGAYTVNSINSVSGRGSSTITVKFLGAGAMTVQSGVTYNLIAY